MLFRTHASSCIAIAAFALCHVCASLLQVMIALAVETLRGQQQELIAARAVIEGHVGIVPLAVDFAAAPHMQFVVLLSRSGGRQTCDGLGPDSCLQAHQAKKLRIALADAFFVVQKSGEAVGSIRISIVIGIMLDQALMALTFCFCVLQALIAALVMRRSFCA